MNGKEAFEKFCKSENSKMESSKPKKRYDASFCSALSMAVPKIKQVRKCKK